MFDIASFARTEYIHTQELHPPKRYIHTQETFIIARITRSHSQQPRTLPCMLLFSFPIIFSLQILSDPDGYIDRVKTDAMSKQKKVPHLLGFSVICQGLMRLHVRGKSDRCHLSNELSLNETHTVWLICSACLACFQAIATAQKSEIKVCSRMQLTIDAT